MMIEDPVATSGGLLSGSSAADGSLRIFRGIPYAAPPVGALRWRAPRAGVPWPGLRDCTRFGDVCPQPPVPDDSIMRLFSFGDPPESGQSEDCLHLNIWTPACSNADRLPVIVWIHGGGHRVGGGSHPAYWGDNLAARGCVVVTLNYRLGALGYLAHPSLTAEEGASGNYACLDIVAALDWVKTNIANFGGDPERVTLYGQSAGAAHVSALMAAPAARGLFHRAIGSAGGHFNGGMLGRPMQSLADAEQAGERLAAAIGCADLAALRALPATALVGVGGPWDLIVDGKALPADVDGSFRLGSQAHVPLMVGYNADEATPYPWPVLPDVAAWQRYATETFGDLAAAFLQLYPREDDAGAARSSYAARRDGDFAYQPWRWGSLHSRTGEAPVYFHYFDRAAPFVAATHFREPVPADGFGAFHGSDIFAAFGSDHAGKFRWSDDILATADVFSSAIVRFAACGDPNPEGANRRDWPPFPENAFRFGRELSAGPLPGAAALALFDAHYSQLCN